MNNKIKKSNDEFINKMYYNLIKRANQSHDDAYVAKIEKQLLGIEERLMSNSIYTTFNGRRMLYKNQAVTRIIYEIMHDCTLTDEDVIHHIDGNCTNDKIHNLKKMTVKGHRRIHMNGRKNPLFKYLYTVLDADNNPIGTREPLHYYMDNWGWNVNSLIYHKNCVNGVLEFKNGKRAGWTLYVHDTTKGE